MELLRQMLDLVALRETQLSVFFHDFYLYIAKFYYPAETEHLKADELYSAYSKCDTV